MSVRSAYKKSISSSVLEKTIDDAQKGLRSKSPIGAGGYAMDASRAVALAKCLISASSSERNYRWQKLRGRIL